LEVEETEGAFDASMYSTRVAQLKINGNHKMDAIHEFETPVQQHIHQHLKIFEG